MKIRKYSTTNHIIEGLIIAISLCAFIYIEHFHLLSGYIKLTINTLLALFGLYRLLRAPTPVWFFSGFFLGIGWLWWMSVSFYYYKLPLLIPVAILIFGLFYGGVFGFTRFMMGKVADKLEAYFLAIDATKSIYILNTVALLLINQIEPFGFNWLKLQLIFVESLLSPKLWSFALILAILALFATFKKAPILLALLLCTDLRHSTILKPNSLRDIALVTTHVDIRQKWLPKNQQKFTNLALEKIDRAIQQHKKLIILPESLLPYFLNLQTPILNKLLAKSKQITIVIGALYYKGKNNFRNSAYIIADGNYTIANKVVLVPFGEANPLPRWMGSLVNKIFFDGSVDYRGDREFTYIKALGKAYKIAICYEGTAAVTYKDEPEFLILISNDGWFKPSIEPTEQKLLLKFFSKLHNTTIYHSLNGSDSYIVVPHPKDI